jgi:hypothetical protein
MTQKMSSKRNRGAPFGRANAPSRGFDSRHFIGAGSTGLDADIKGQSIDEIDIARVNILLLAELLKDDKYRSMADVIAGSDGFRYLLECIRNLSREQKSMYQNMTTAEQPPQDLNDICAAED